MIYTYAFYHVGRGGVVVSALDLRSEGRWFKAQSRYRVVSSDKKTLLHIVSFHPVYKWVPATDCLGQPCDGLASHLGESGNTLRCFMLQKPG